MSWVSQKAWVNPSVDGAKQLNSQGQTCPWSNTQEGGHFTRPRWCQVSRRRLKCSLRQALGGLGTQSRMRLGALEGAQEGCLERAGVSWPWWETSGHPSSCGSQTGHPRAPEIYPFFSRWVTIPLPLAFRAQVPILLVSSAALVQPRLEGQRRCLACSADPPGSPAQAGDPPPAGSPKPHLEPCLPQQRSPPRRGHWGLLPAARLLGLWAALDDRTVHVLARLGRTWGSPVAGFTVGFDGIAGDREERESPCAGGLPALPQRPGLPALLRVRRCQGPASVPGSHQTFQKRAQEILKVTAAE